MESGVARVEIDLEAYRRKLEVLLSRTREVMRGASTRRAQIRNGSSFGRRAPEVPARARNPRASEDLPAGAARAAENRSREAQGDFSIPAGKIEFIDISHFLAARRVCADRLGYLRERRGVTCEDARQEVLHRNVFRALMVEMGRPTG